jgi:ketol-acid reductoisomerase
MTVRRGALDWAPIFEKANRPVFEALYKSVKDGTETRNSLEFNGRKTYRGDFKTWRTGKTV